MNNNEMNDLVYILKHQPYKENQHIAQAWSLAHGKVSIFLPKKYPPRYLYRYRVQWKTAPKLKILEMNIEHIHTLTGRNMLASYYVLEWMLTFASDHMENSDLFYLFTHTLDALEHADSASDIEKLLRIYERQSLAHLGYGLNASHLDTLEGTYVSYHPHSGYQAHRDNSQSMPPRMTKDQLLDILTDCYELEGSLKLAKKWFQSIVKILLPHHEWKCRLLYQNIPH